MSIKNKYLIVIAGPTAIGKTTVAIQLAQLLNTDIISSDSRQVYEEMSIGTAKPSIEELNAVKHHFIGHVKIKEEYNVGSYEKGVIAFLADYFKQRDVAILCGGSGLYIDAVCYGLDEFPPISEKTKKKVATLVEEGKDMLQRTLLSVDPDYYYKTDIENTRRIARALEVYFETKKPFSRFLTEARQKKKREFIPIKICLHTAREKLYTRIDQRVDSMMKAGLLEEVKSLIPYASLKAMDTVGYKELMSYFRGQMTLPEAIDKIKQHTRNYAKRQITWFKKHEDYAWFHPEEIEEIIKYITQSKHD